MVDLFSKRHRFWLWVLALLLAGGGQWLLALPDPTPWHAGLLFALALPVAALAWGPRGLAEPQPAPTPPAPRPWALPLALLAALGAWLGAANNRFTWWGVACWLASVGLWLVTWRVLGWPARPRRAVSARRAAPFLLAFVLILLAAALFRFWGINTLPPEMTSDHAEKLLDVGDILAGQRPIFLERNTGREPMQFYVTALLAGPLGLGLSHLALKVGTATIGLLTVPLTFLVARRGLGLSRRAALLAMALLALSKWHVEIARVGLRFPYAPFGVALTLLFFFRALRLGARRDWLLAGLAFGVALYGYTPIRIVPLLLALGGALYLLLEQARGHSGLAWRDALTNVLLLPATTLLVFVPLLRYSVENPEMFWYRSTSRAVDGVAGNLVGVFWGNVRNAALMFHVRGDEVWVNTLPFDPVLDRVTGALFLLGLGIALWVVLRRWRALELTLLLALPILLLPSILALGWPSENPSVVRAGGALPIVMILAALPLDAFLASLGRLRGRAALPGAAPALRASCVSERKGVLWTLRARVRPTILEFQRGGAGDPGARGADWRRGARLRAKLASLD